VECYYRSEGIRKELALIDNITSLESVARQDKIYRMLLEFPEWRGHVAEMVGWQQSHPLRDQWDGFEWAEVHTPVSIISRMIARGVLDQRFHSHSSTRYALHDLDDTRSALASLNVPGIEDGEIDYDSLFNLVVGHDNVKKLVRLALKADGPVHCLLIGPPGTAKTLMLSDVGRLAGAEFYVGSTTSKSGLVGLLLSVQPKFLVIDELDKMDDKDMSPLLNLMETGMVARLLHGKQERITIETKVFAGANDVRRISAPILSRFAKFDIAPYSPPQFVEVARAVLTQREGLGPEMALHIATEVVDRSTDIRDAVRVARMAAGNPLMVTEIVHCLWPGHVERKITPLPKRG
jgi:Holliday junction DNA helicase RuvB